MIELKHPGRMINFSKSAYTKRYPKHLVIFNANIFTKERGKIWYGDIDLDRKTDQRALTKIAKGENEELWILAERDGRFQFETDPLWDRYIARVKPDGTIDRNTENV